MGNKEETYNIPTELRDAVCNDKLIIFVGAGLSYNLKNTQDETLGGWGHLVEKILDHLSSKGHETNYLIPLLEHVEPVDVLGLIEKVKPPLPKSDIFNFTKDFLDLSDNNDFSLHKKILSLSKKVITTNYDTAFELADPQYRKHTAYKGKNFELSTHRDSNTKLLYKLHGCYLDSDSLVLFPSQYRALYENERRDAEHALMVMKNIIMNYTVLFIGTGMGDFQINNLFNVIKKLQGEHNQQHFIITSKDLDSSLSFLNPLKINDYSEIENTIDELINISETNKTDDEVKLEQQLVQARIENDSLKEQLTPSQEQKKLAIEYYIEGIEYKLDSKFQDAIKCYQTAALLQSDSHNVWNNWGNALADLARTKDDKGAEKLFKQACNKYDKATSIKEDYLLAWNNWGNALVTFAKTKDGKDAENLFKQACNKYDKATSIKEDDHLAWYNWGTLLIYLAKAKDGKDAENLFKQSFEKLTTAYELSGNCYNLACCYSLRKNKSEALKYLEISLTNNEINKAIVLKDTDWNTLINDTDFKKLLERF